MNSKRGGWRSGPLGLAGALVLVVLIEALVASHTIEVSSPARFEWRQSRLAATAQAPQAKLLALGTSMTKLGLYSTVVTRESGRTTLNLAQCGGRMESAFYLLRHALEAGSQPDAVLLEVHPAYMTIPYHDGLSAWSDLLDWSDLVDLAQTNWRGDFVGTTALGSLLPSVRSRHEIRELTLKAFRREGSFYRDANTSLIRHFAQNAGAHVNRRQTPYAGETHPFLAGIYLPMSWHPEGVNARYLRRTLGLCRRRAIPVYWVIPPVAPLLQACRHIQGLEAAYDAFLGRVRADYPEVAVLDARLAQYPPAAFFDAAHLDYNGAVAFSAEIGRLVRADLATHRPARSPGPLIPLPLYRDQTTDAPLEDMAQTGRILAEAAATKIIR